MGPGRVRPWDLSWSRTCREVGWRAEAQMRGSSEKRSRGRQQVGTDRRDLFWSEWAGQAGPDTHHLPAVPWRNLHAIHEVHQGLP